MNVLVTEFLHVEARCARRIGYQSDRAQHVHPAIVPVKHRLITRNRFLVASSILTPFRTRNLARERVSFARSLFSHSRFVSENRSRPSSLFGGLDFETTNYETWKLRPFPDARERNFIIKRRFLIVFLAFLRISRAFASGRVCAREQVENGKDDIICLFQIRRGKCLTMGRI